MKFFAVILCLCKGIFADGPSKPKFNGGFRLFELDACENYGKVCLVFREAKPSSGKCVRKNPAAVHYIQDNKKMFLFFIFYFFYFTKTSFGFMHFLFIQECQISVINVQFFVCVVGVCVYPV